MEDLVWWWIYTTQAKEKAPPGVTAITEDSFDDSCHSLQVIVSGE